MREILNLDKIFNPQPCDVKANLFYENFIYFWKLFRSGMYLKLLFSK